MLTCTRLPASFSCDRVRSPTYLLRLHLYTYIYYCDVCTTCALNHALNGLYQKQDETHSEQLLSSRCLSSSSVRLFVVSRFEIPNVVRSKHNSSEIDIRGTPFVVTWRSRGDIDDRSFNIYARTYDGQKGDAVDNVFRVNILMTAAIITHLT